MKQSPPFRLPWLMKAPPPPAERPGRLMHLDALRGLLLLMMAMDHIPSDLQRITNHPFGFMSAAEGFVLLAGIMAGFVFSRKLALGTWSATERAAQKRAASIYSWHLGTYALIWIGVTLAVRLTGQAPGGAPELMSERPLLALFAGASFLYQPGMLDILPLYCLCFLALPMLLRRLEQGARWPLLLMSAAVWGLTNLWWPSSPVVAGFVNLGAFNFGAWQFLFVVGVTLGHAWARGERLIPTPAPWPIAVAATVAAVLWFVRHGHTDLSLPMEWWHEQTNKNSLAPVRLLNVTVLAYLAYAILTVRPKVLHYQPLALLGSHSIVVFSAHIVLATTINALPAVFAETPEGRFLGTMTMLFGIFAAAGCSALRKSSTARAPAPIRNSRRLVSGDIRAT